MATRTLRELCEEIQELIHQEQIPEALRTARHVLAYFPQHLETYTLVGEACLESGNVREAVEMFQRALGADPEHLRAWLGMASAYEQDELPEKALWYLERAFEVEPSHAGIRAELKRLYSEVQGVKGLRVKLNNAALGRIYLRGGLYQLAVDEFREVLTRHPEYYHVRTGLAQALWYLGRHVEAAQACQELLEDLPNCLEALLILGEIWSRGDQPEEGQSLLQAAEALDPENRKAQEIFGPDSPLPPKNPTLPPVGVLPAGAPPTVPIPAPTISEALIGGEGLSPTPIKEEETPAVETPEAGALPSLESLFEEGEEEVPASWLEETPPADRAAELEEMGEAPAPTFEAEAPLPAWLREEVKAPEEEEVGPMPSAAEEEGHPEAAGLAEAPQAPADLHAVAAELPDELRALVEDVLKGEAPAEEEKTVEEAPAPEAPPCAVPGAEAPTEERGALDLRAIALELPEELRGLVEEALQAEAPIEETAPAEGAIETEETVGEISARVAPAEPTPRPEVAGEAEIPPWLRDLAEAEEKEEIYPTPAETLPQEAAEEVPEWLQRLAEQSVSEEEEAAEEKEPEPEEAGAVPEWLLSAEMAEERSEAEEGVLEAGEETMPDWLQRLREAAIQDVPALESELEGPAEPVLAEPVSEVAEEPALAPEEEESAPLIAEAEVPAAEAGEALEVEATPPAEGAAAEASLEELEAEGLVAREISESMWEEMYLGALVGEGEPSLMEAPAPVEDLTPIEEVERVEEPLAPVEAAPAEELPTAVETLQEEMTEAIEAEEVVAEPAEEVEEVAAAPAEEVKTPSSFIAQALERLSVRPDDHEMRLAAARALRDAGRLEEAISHYEALIEAGQFTDAIVGDLERTAPEAIIPEQTARLWTVLGDAYMRQGRLTDALQAYRQALGRSA